jgi:hypothetical protein
MPLARSTVERLKCDSSIVALIHRRGMPLNITFKDRSISAPLRRALNARDERAAGPVVIARLA